MNNEGLKWVILMFVLRCVCGEELYCSGEEDATEAWQCEACGRWYDYFGYEIPSPAKQPPFYEDGAQ